MNQTFVETTTSIDQLMTVWLPIAAIVLWACAALGALVVWRGSARLLWQNLARRERRLVGALAAMGEAVWRYVFGREIA